MADENKGDKVVQLTAPNGIQVSVAASKVEARLANGFTLFTGKAPAKKAPAKPAAAKKAAPKKQSAKKAAAPKKSAEPAAPAE